MSGFRIFIQQFATKTQNLEVAPSIKITKYHDWPQKKLFSSVQ